MQNSNMKNLILFLLLALVGCAQQHDGKPPRVKGLPLKEIPVTDKMQYTYLLTPRFDTLRWFNAGQDSFKVTMTFNKVSTGYPLPDVVTHVDDNFYGQEYQVLKYQPQNFMGDNIINPLGWNFGKDQVFNVAHHNNTLAFLQTDGWIDFEFTGYKIQYYAEQFESYGIAGVSIDHGPEVMVDLYQPWNYNNSMVVFTADSLENNVAHTIRVRYTRQRNPNANSANARINLDKFTYYYHQGTYYQPPVPEPAKQQYEQK
jgi:hypothetical protein